MNIDQLRTFRTVIELGSFSRASEVLHVSQSTVSFQVKALETAVGARLIDRRGRSVRVTPTGRVLLGFARRMIALRDEALHRLRAEETGQRGRVTIAASTIPAEYLLPPLLGEFQRAHPEVTLILKVSDSRQATAALLGEDCDLACVGSPIRDRRVACVRFSHDEIVLVAPASGPYATSETSRLGLGDLPIILREPGSGTREAVAKLLPAGLAEREGHIEAGSTEAARRCVLEGLGLTFISRTAVKEDLAAGRVRLVKLRGTPLKRTFYMGRLLGVTASAAARAFLKLVIDRAPG